MYTLIPRWIHVNLDFLILGVNNSLLKHIRKSLYKSDQLRSLETNASLDITANVSKESWHSINLNFIFAVDIISLPQLLETFIDVCFSFLLTLLKVSSNNFDRDIMSTLRIKPEMTIRLSTISTLMSKVVIKWPHQSIISITFKSVGSIPDVSMIATESIKPMGIWRTTVSTSRFPTISSLNHMNRGLSFNVGWRFGIRFRCRILLLLNKFIWASVMVIFICISTSFLNISESKKRSYDNRILHYFYI